MKISKYLQKNYCTLARDAKFQEMESLFQKTKEKFDVVYSIYHSLLNWEDACKIIKLAYQNGRTEVSVYWSIEARGKQRSLINWLFDCRGMLASTSLAHLILLGFSLSDDEYFELLFGKHSGKFKRWDFQSKFSAEDIKKLDRVIFASAPPYIIEQTGRNYYTWLLERGIVDQLDSFYQPGILFQQQGLIPYINFTIGEERWNWVKGKLGNDKIPGLDIEIQSKKILYKEYSLINIFEKNLFLELEIKEDKLRDVIIEYFKSKETISYALINALVEIKQTFKEEIKLDAQIAKIIVGLNKQNIYNEVGRKELWDFLSENTEYSDYRKKKLVLIGSNKSTFEDLKRMHKTRKENAVALNISLLPEKPQCFYEIHNWLMRIPEALDNDREINQKIQKDMPEFKNDKYSVYYPSSDLMFIKQGLELNICVGDSYYRDMAFSQELNVVIIQDFNGKSIACVEIDLTGDVLQSVSYGNSEVSQDVSQFVSLFIQTWLKKTNS